jgi:hypothetical protein
MMSQVNPLFKQIPIVTRLEVEIHPERKTYKIIYKVDRGVERLMLS